MGKGNWAKIVKSAQNAIARHSPEILTGLGIAGMLTTTVLAVKATPKALRIIEDEKEETGCEKIRPVDAVKLTWKCYIPAAVTCTASIACLVGASSVHVRRNAALAAAYKLSETALEEYRESVVETIGERKERTVRDKVAENQVRNNPASNNEVVITGNGDSRFFDPMSSRHFYSSIEKVKKAANDLNEEMIHSICSYMSLNDFYDEIGLSHMDVGDIVGWNTERLIKLDFSAQVDDDGQPSLVIEYLTRPEYGYDR